LVNAALIAVSVVSTPQPPPAASSPKIRACALVPKEEVKKHLPAKHLLTLQADWDGKSASVKPGVMNLAKALAAKLH
jgi:hypothetical protein